MKREQIRQKMDLYNIWANFYDSRYSLIQNRKYELILEKIEIRKEDMILDVGCGTGNLFQFLEQNSCSKYGVDFSISCLKQCHQKNKDNSIIYNVCADIDHLPFREKSFDIIFLITILQNIPNPEKSLIEIKKVCKQKSLIILSLLKKKFPRARITHLLELAKLKPDEIIDKEDCEDFIVIIREF